MGIATICSTLCAIILLWNEDKVSCDIVTCKVLETMFIIVALLSAREEAKLKF